MESKAGRGRLVPAMDGAVEQVSRVASPLIVLGRSSAAELDEQNLTLQFKQLARRVNEERQKRAEVRNAKADVTEFRWKHNAPRRSFISYRVAQVALEAGNSPQMILRHYRELVRPMHAAKWFSIVPDGCEGKVIEMPKALAA